MGFEAQNLSHHGKIQTVNLAVQVNLRQFCLTPLTQTSLKQRIKLRDESPPYKVGKHTGVSNFILRSVFAIFRQDQLMFSAIKPSIFVTISISCLILAFAYQVWSMDISSLSFNFWGAEGELRARSVKATRLIKSSNTKTQASNLNKQGNKLSSNPSSFLQNNLIVFS